MRYGHHQKFLDVLYDRASAEGLGKRIGGVRMCLCNNEKGCDVIDNRKWMHPDF